MLRAFPTAVGILLAGICLSQAQTGSYSIDIDSAALSGTDTTGPIATEPGWTSLDATLGNGSPGVTVGGITFTVGSADGSRIRLSGGQPNPNALTGDFIYDDGPGEAVVLFIGGSGSLPAGPWQVEMWIWDQGAALGNMIVGFRRNTIETIVSSNAIPDAAAPSVVFSMESDGVSAYDVFVRENSSQNRARLSAVRLTRIAATAVNLLPGSISPSLPVNQEVGRLVPVSSWASAGYSFSLVAGEGDTHNDEFVIVGDELQTSADWADSHTIGETLSIRVRVVDAEAGVYEGPVLISVIKDSDNDGLDDDWELEFFVDLTVATGGGNNDGDALINTAEFERNTFPDDEDSDDDGLNDDVEDNSGIFGGPASPGTDPRNPDTDGDTVDDAKELVDGTNPLRADTDGDGLNDGQEKALGTDPLLADSDGDGIGDATETASGSDPMERSDPAALALLCAYWPLDEAVGDGPYTTPDLGPFNYPLNLDNLTPADFVNVAGRMAASFNGVDAMLTRIHAPGEALPASQHNGFTVSAWVKIKGTGQSDRRFFFPKARRRTRIRC